jgi:Phage integrase, N-terminal SAM-like domain
MPVSSVERPVSALRQRMLEDMAMRGLRSDTQHDYVRVVRSFAAFLGQPPDTATAEDIRRFQVHQRESGVQPPTPSIAWHFGAMASGPLLWPSLPDSTAVRARLGTFFAARGVPAPVAAGGAAWLVTGPILNARAKPRRVPLLGPEARE